MRLPTINYGLGNFTPVCRAQGLPVAAKDAMDILICRSKIPGAKSGSVHSALSGEVFQLARRHVSHGGVS